MLHYQAAEAVSIVPNQFHLSVTSPSSNDSPLEEEIPRHEEDTLVAFLERRLFPLPKELPHRQVVPAEGDVGQNKSLQNKKPMAVGLPLVRAQRERSRRQQGLPAEFSLK